MSKALIDRLFEKVDGQDWEGLREVFDPEASYERPGYSAFEGIDRLLHFYSEERVIACGRHQLSAVVVDGDQGACWGRFVGTHRNGTEIDESFADFYTFRDGRILTRRSFFFRPAV